MPAKQLKASVYQVPGVAVTGSSCTRTSETTRDRALILKKDPKLGRGRDLRRSIPLTKAQGWVEAANLRVTPRLICERSQAYKERTDEAPQVHGIGVDDYDYTG
jgi:hypothetical protein